MTLDITMTGAWSGDNIKVTAKVWNGKITKSSTLSGSYVVDSIALDSTMYNDEYAVFIVTTSQYIGSSRNQHKNTFSQVSVKGIAIEGWKKARENTSSWVNYDLEYGEVRYITVPSSTYGQYTNFKITGKSLDIGDIGSVDGHSNFPYERIVYVYDSNGYRIAGPFSCTTINEYNEGWKRAANSEQNCITTSLNPGTSITITVPTTTAGSTRQFTVTAKTSGSGGGGGGGCCFPAGTPVLLADGTTMPIEKLTLGTIVAGYDPDTQEFCETEIMRTVQKKHRSDIYELERADGITFLMTANHVVLTKNGWKAIDAERGQYGVPEENITELIIGDELLGVDGNYIKILDIKYRDDLQDQNVYNIDVEEVDTYIAYGIVVHNDVDCPE